MSVTAVLISGRGVAVMALPDARPVVYVPVLKGPEPTPGRVLSPMSSRVRELVYRRMTGALADGIATYVEDERTK